MTLPADILAALEKHTGSILTVTQPPQGKNVSVWLLVTERGPFIVKSSGDATKIAAIAQEAAILALLTTYAPRVPRFVARVGNCFLLTYLEGVNLAVVMDATKDSDMRHHLSGEYGRLLRSIHGWEPPVTRPVDWFADALARAEKNADEAGWDTLLKENRLWAGLPHHVLWQEIAESKDKMSPQAVWCHGDWCLPNVLITNGTASGAIDWGDGGWADYRMDIAMGLKSLRYNCDVLDNDPQTPRYLDAFLSGYGYPDTVGSLRFWEALCLLY